MLVVGVALPTFRMARIAAESSRLQYADYWPMLDTIIHDDGSVRWAGVIELRNGHPVVTAKLLYLLDIALFDGSNHAQATMVGIVALGLIVLVGLLARATPDLGRWGRVAVVVAAAFAVMAPQGAWSFVKAMSGAAWLTANLFFLAALVAQHRRRQVLAVAFGFAATASYGTALMVWPALVVAGLLRDGRRWQRQWVVWVGSIAAVIGYVLWRGSTGGSTDAGPIEILKRTAILLVAPMAPDRVSIGVVLMLLAGVGAAAALYACRHRLETTAPWIALMVYGAGAAMLIARSRVVGPDAPGDPYPSRYWSVTLWFWLGLIVLGMLALRGRRWRVVLAGLLVVVMLAEGSAKVQGLRNATINQELLTIALVAGFAEDERIAGGAATFPHVTDKLIALGHYPFDGTFETACGLLGEHVPVEPAASETAQGAEAVQGSVESQPFSNSPGVARLVGSIRVPDGHVECVIVRDAEGIVVGAGHTSPSGGDLVRVRAVAPTQYVLTVAVRLEPDGAFHEVPVVY